MCQLFWQCVSEEITGCTQSGFIESRELLFGAKSVSKKPAVEPMLIGNTEVDLGDTSYLLKVYGRLTHAVLCCAQFKTLFFWLSGSCFSGYLLVWWFVFRGQRKFTQITSSCQYCLKKNVILTLISLGNESCSYITSSRAVCLDLWSFSFF